MTKEEFEKAIKKENQSLYGLEQHYLFSFRLGALWAYENYVKKLQAENETLKLEIENLNIKIDDLQSWNKDRL